MAFGVPYRLAFAHPVVLWSWWFWFDLVVDIYFLADIYVSLRTAFYTERGELVVDERTIRKHYQRTWFPIDALACFPGNYVSATTVRSMVPRIVVSLTCCYPTLVQISYFIDSMSSTEDGGSRGIKLLRMLRLLKLLRLARVNRMIQVHADTM